TLQGWAIVENTTDQDWNDVRLSLVAGRPVSFQMDLYEPLYVERAQVPVPVVAGVAPRQYQGTNMALGLRDMVAKSVSDQRQPGRGRPAAAPAPAGTAVPAEAGSERDFSIADYPASARQEMARELSAADLDAYAPEAAAAAGMVGEVFQYDLSSPVTIERQRSALIPIITASVPTRRVSIFNLADGSQHPMRGVEIINPAEAGRGLQLLPGPISVFDGAAYAGDAQIGHIPPGDNRLLAYAVDLDVVALTRPEHTSSVTRLRIVGGLVEQIVKQRNRVVYGFENKDAAAPRTVLIEHPRLQHGEWELAEPKTAAQTTPSYYRFELELAPKGSGTLTVAQETTERHTVAVTSFDLETVLALHRDGKLSDRVLETFREISRRQGELADLERTLGEVDRQVAAISADQQRIRSNMGAIERNSELYVQYMRKLTEQEGRLEQLGAQRAETLQRLEAGRAALDEYLRTLDVE
ncbi:MAG TPA: hypothetical protein VD963_00715, partial [Phycisphaerales bacterium]|nr:hypothetical protein [Phycisphaerales bacterium]